MKKLVITAIIALAFTGLNAQTPDETEWSCFKDDGGCPPKASGHLTKDDTKDGRTTSTSGRLTKDDTQDAYEWSCFKDDSPNLIKDDTKGE